MSMDFIKIELPALWASYLVNGDASTLDVAERGAVDEWLEDNNYRQHCCIPATDAPSIGRFSGVVCKVLEYYLMR